MCFAFMILWISLCLALCPGAAILGAIDYKKTFARTYGSDDEVMEAYSQCHARSAKRVLKALLANGGVSQSVDSWSVPCWSCVCSQVYLSKWASIWLPCE